MKPLQINHIVLADDDSDHGLLFERVLHQLYPEILISHVSDGGQLLPFLRLHPVDMLFLDIKMPCKTGDECLREIRNNPAFTSLPIIMYSNSADLSSMQKCFANEANFYMVKPYSADHLKNAFEFLFSIDWKDRVPPKHYFMNNRFVPFTSIA